MLAFDESPEEKDPYAQGRENRDEGIKTAIEHANAINPCWEDEATAALKKYAADFGREPFLCEDVRGWAEREGLDKPPSARAWGHIMKAAAAKNVIRKVGAKSVKNPNANMAFATLWVSV